jgi:tetrahydrodipicolinate N-succinyltransferase
MTIVYDGVLLDVTAKVAKTAMIGASYRPLLNGRRYRSTGKTQIGPGCWIGEGVQVGEGAIIGANSILHGDSRVESDARLGSGVLLTYRSWVDLKARIGDDCVIGGYVCERAVVGRGCRVFGDLTIVSTTRCSVGTTTSRRRSRRSSRTRSSWAGRRRSSGQWSLRRARTSAPARSSPSGSRAATSPTASTR